MEISKKDEDNKDKFFVKISFLIFGIGGLLPWNAILSQLDYFSKYLKKSFQPSVYFPFLNVFLNIIFQFYLLYKPKITTYKTQLLFCFIIVAISLITLPITVYLLSNFEILNIIITSIMILLQGLLNAICQSSAFGLVSFFPFEMIVSLSAGQAIAGILTNIIAFIIKFFFEDVSHETEALVYFSITTFIIIINFIFVILVYKNNYFKSQLTLSGEFNNNEQKNNDNFINKNENNSESDKEINKQKTKEISFMDLSKLLKTVNILVTILYTTTFTLYPNSFILFESLSKLLQSYQIITILSIYNVLDIIGRYSANYFPQTQLSIYIICLSRLSLLILIPFLHTFNNYDSIILNIFIFICIAFLGITNGIGSSLIFGFAPTLVPDELKGKAGSSISFFLITGIFIGTCCNFLMNYIITKIKE